MAPPLLTPQQRTHISPKPPSALTWAGLACSFLVFAGAGPLGAAGATPPSFEDATGNCSCSVVVYYNDHFCAFQKDINTVKFKEQQVLLDGGKCLFRPGDTSMRISYRCGQWGMYTNGDCQETPFISGFSGKCFSFLDQDASLKFSEGEDKVESFLMTCTPVKERIVVRGVAEEAEVEPIPWCKDWFPIGFMVFMYIITCFMLGATLLGMGYSYYWRWTPEKVNRFGDPAANKWLGKHWLLFGICLFFFVCSLLVAIFGAGWVWTEHVFFCGHVPIFIIYFLVVVIIVLFIVISYGRAWYGDRRRRMEEKERVEQQVEQQYRKISAPKSVRRRNPDQIFW